MKDIRYYAAGLLAASIFFSTVTLSAQSKEQVVEDIIAASRLPEMTEYISDQLTETLDDGGTGDEYMTEMFKESFSSEDVLSNFVGGVRSRLIESLSIGEGRQLLTLMNDPAMQAVIDHDIEALQKGDMDEDEIDLDTVDPERLGIYVDIVDSFAMDDLLTEIAGNIADVMIDLMVSIFPEEVDPEEIRESMMNDMGFISDMRESLLKLFAEMYDDLPMHQLLAYSELCKQPVMKKYVAAYAFSVGDIFAEAMSSFLMMMFSQASG